MSIHSFGYSVDSLQKDKIEILEKELESQTELISIKLNDMSEKLEKFDETDNIKKLILTTVKPR